MKTEYIKIHHALHDPKRSVVLLDDGSMVPITKAANGCRQAYYDKINFMTQNPNKHTAYAERARKGEHITWGIKAGSWLYIDDNTLPEIVKR